MADVKEISTSKESFFSNYKFLFEKHPESIFVMNPLGDIVYVNQSALNRFGYTKGELINRNYIDIVCSDEHETIHYYFQEAVNGKSAEFKTMFTCKNRDNVEIQLRIVPNIMDGKLVSISGFAHDVTKQDKLQLEIIEASKKLCESFIENHSDPILLLDLNNTIVLSNRAFSQLLGWRKENLEGFPILKCPSIPPHLVEQMKEYCQRVIDNEPGLSKLETIRVTDNGKAFHMMLSITPIQDQNGQICNRAVHLRDITAQKEAEQSLSRAEKLMAIGKLSSTIIEKMNKPLQSLKGCMRLLSLSTDSNDLFKKMYTEFNHIDNILGELSGLARIQEKSFEMADTYFLIESAISSLEILAALNNVQIECDCNQIPTILCEKDQLQQAFFNIIENGIEAMPSGGTLYVTSQIQDKYLEINVTDQGGGFPEGRIPKLGEEIIYSNKEKRVGLGLTLAYKIIKQHHGELKLHTQLGHGTKVTISLPIF